MNRSAKTGAADIRVDAGSVSTAVPALDTHLKSKDFFNGGKVTTVSGNLTLLKRDVRSGDFETTITRSQWGMNYELNFGPASQRPVADPDRSDQAVDGHGFAVPGAP